MLYIYSYYEIRIYFYDIYNYIYINIYLCIYMYIYINTNILRNIYILYKVIYIYSHM